MSRYWIVVEQHLMRFTTPWGLVSTQPSPDWTPYRDHGVDDKTLLPGHGIGDKKIDLPGIHRNDAITRAMQHSRVSQHFPPARRDWSGGGALPVLPIRGFGNRFLGSCKLISMTLIRLCDIMIDDNRPAWGSLTVFQKI